MANGNGTDWKKVARALLMAGGLNWGLIGLFGFNPVGAIFGPLARLVYIAVGWAAIYSWTETNGG